MEIIDRAAVWSNARKPADYFPAAIPLAGISCSMDFLWADFPRQTFTF
ncbi:MAG: hypothetical protein OXU34_02000 [Gammaproteobacteria bacterium]|nr:hypothetical protein [Gammaproteobacteria bacterium]